MRKSLSFLLFIFLTTQTACGQSRASQDSPTGTDTKLVPTVYYHPLLNIEAESCSSNELKDITNSKGEKVATICSKDIKNCARQGSCTVLNQGNHIHFVYEKHKNGVVFFEKYDLDDCHYGFGVQNICVDPYHSVAADLTIYKTGDVIFVPTVRGAVLPTGEVHDGYFIVRDTGNAIKGLGRFDFYTGYEAPFEAKNTFAKMNLNDPKEKFDYVLVKDSAIIEKVKKLRKYPLVPKMNY